MQDKPLKAFRPTACDFADMHPSEQGIVVIGFVLSGDTDLALELTPQVLASLEAKLAAVRSEHVGKRGLQ